MQQIITKSYSLKRPIYLLMYSIFLFKSTKNVPNAALKQCALKMILTISVKCRSISRTLKHWSKEPHWKHTQSDSWNIKHLLMLGAVYQQKLVLLTTYLYNYPDTLAKKIKHKDGSHHSSSSVFLVSFHVVSSNSIGPCYYLLYW